MNILVSRAIKIIIKIIVMFFFIIVRHDEVDVFIEKVLIIVLEYCLSTVRATKNGA